MTHIDSDAYKLYVPPLSETTTNVIKKDRIAMCAEKGNTGKKEGNKVDGAPYFGWHRETSDACYK